MPSPDYSKAYTRINPLKTMGSLAQMQNNMLQARALRQQIDANQAASQAMGGSFDPETGQINYSIFAEKLSQDPRGAYNLPEVMGKAMQQQKMQGEMEKMGVETTGLRQQQALNQMESMRAGLIGAETPEMGASFIQNLIETGAVKQEVGQQMLGQLSSVGNDPAAYNALRRQTIAAVEGNINNIKPSIEAYNLGNRQGVIQRDPLTGQVGGSEVYEMGMRPGESAMPVGVYDEGTGQPRTITRGQFAAAAGGGGGMGFASGPGLGAEKTVEGAIGRYNERIAAVPGINNTIQSLNEAEKILNEGVIAGPGSGTAMWLAGLGETFGVKLAGHETQKYQELSKYLKNQLADAASAAGFVGSSEKLDLFGKGQPSPESMNPESLANAVRYVKAQQMGAKALATASAQVKQMPGGNVFLDKFEAEWSKVYSPDVMYFYSLSTPELKQAYLGDLSPKEAEKFGNAYTKMQDMGAFSAGY